MMQLNQPRALQTLLVLIFILLRIFWLYLQVLESSMHVLLLRVLVAISEKLLYVRSNFAVKFTDVSAGVIDSDYRGHICVLSFNFSNNIIEIEKSSRFAEIEFQKCARSSLREVETFAARSTLRCQMVSVQQDYNNLFFIFKYLIDVFW